MRKEKKGREEGEDDRCATTDEGVQLLRQAQIEYRTLLFQAMNAENRQVHEHCHHLHFNAAVTLHTN